MARIYGKSGSTNGEKRIYKVLSTLSDDWFVYSEPEIHHPDQTYFPDFVVLHKDLGFIVIEVKDWLEAEPDGYEALVFVKKTNTIVKQDSPVRQALSKCHKITDLLKKDANLFDSAGRFKVAYRYAGFLPNFLNYNLKPLRIAWGPQHIFGGNEVLENSIEMTLRSIPAPQKDRLTDSEIDRIRVVLDPNLRLENGGILDKTQEAYAKQPLKPINEDNQEIKRLQLSIDIGTRIRAMEDSLPQEISNVSNNYSVRLIRGVAGTGKTDVVILRSNYLKKNYPDAKILVTTFNKEVSEKRLQHKIEILQPTVVFKRFMQICSDIVSQKYPLFTEPQGTDGVVNAILNEEGYQDFRNFFGSEFLIEEIQWMKETDRTSFDAYVNTVREGRSSSKVRSLSRSQKIEIFDFFKTYQRYLQQLPAIDWCDHPQRALDLLKSNEVSMEKYDEIIVDEAQHFAPKWIELLQHLLKESGSLFLCEDPTQRVYRSFSWKQKGVNVIGRTRWLKVPYRSTRQILQAAYSLIRNNDAAVDILKEEDSYEFPDLSAPELRDGGLPQIHEFNSLGDQRDFVRSEIRNLVNRGISPEDIAILHNKKFVIDDYSDLISEGITVGEIRRQTGMEYKAVFLPKIANFFIANDLDDKRSEERNLANLYTAITRAKDFVYILHEEKRPKELIPLLEYSEIINH